MTISVLQRLRALRRPRTLAGSLASAAAAAEAAAIARPRSQRGAAAPLRWAQALRTRLPRLNTRWLLTLGLTSVAVSILLVAQFIGLLPDRRASALHERTTIAAAVSAASGGRSFDEGPDSMKLMFELLVERHPALRSVAVRRQDGTVVLHTGEPVPALSMERDDPTIDLMLLPLDIDGRRWGRIELHYQPLTAEGWRALVDSPMVRLTAFLIVSCLFSFNLYLRRMLRHLDPSRAVPERVQKAFDTLSEVVLLCDKNGFILLANRAFADLTGADPASLPGKQVAEFAWLTRDDQPLDVPLSPWRKALDEGQPLRNEYLALRGHDGQRHSFQVNCSPIQAADDKASGVLMSLEDITGLEATQAALRVSQREADDANRAKSEFLANMSHEIRTPMNAILGFANILRRGQSSDAPRHLETIHRNARNLLDLINDILDLSKVESGRLEIDRSDCAPHRLIHEVVEVLSVRAEEKGVALQFDVDGRIPALLSLDATRLRQIITNLTGNAIKFTEQGAVRIIERWHIDNGTAWLQIAIRDSGIGIPSDKIEAIFEPFVQAEGSTTRRFGGTGLGLSISRKFARAMGGDVTVTSEFGRGSTFLISLPFDARSPVALIDSEQAIAESQRVDAIEQRDWEFAPARVLVVDDSPENRELVKLLLSEVGLTIIEAENGQIAVDKVLTEPFDFVLMDVHMPVMDGYTAVGKLRQRQVRTPIVAFTADAIKGFEKQISEAGFSGYLTKPIDVDAMLQLLREHLRTVPIDPATLAQRAPQTPTIATAQASTPPPRPVSGESRTADAPLVSRLAAHPKLARIAAQFAQGLPARMQSLRAAADRGDWNSVAELAHWLKGSAGSVGFDAFTQPAKTLEAAARQGDGDTSLALVMEVEALAARVQAPGSTTTAPDPVARPNALAPAASMTERA